MYAPGLVHEQIYATVLQSQETSGIPVDLLLICGDFQVGLWHPQVLLRLLNAADREQKLINLLILLLTCDPDLHKGYP